MKYTLKHRLIGAAFLAAIAVLFLPSFFREKQAYPVNTKTQIPVRPGIVPIEFNAPKPVPNIDPASAPEKMFVPNDEEPVADSSAARSASSVNAIVNAPKIIKPTLPATIVSDMPLNSKGLPDAWVIQVGSFSTKEAANKIRDDLMAAGFKAYVRTVRNGGVLSSRVYIGPKLDKAQAQAIKVQIDKRLKINSMVKRFEP